MTSTSVGRPLPPPQTLLSPEPWPRGSGLKSPQRFPGSQCGMEWRVQVPRSSRAFLSLSFLTCKTTMGLPTRLVSCNKSPHTEWPETTQIYSFTVPETVFLPRALGRLMPLPLVASRRSLCSLSPGPTLHRKAAVWRLPASQRPCRCLVVFSLPDPCLCLTRTFVITLGQPRQCRVIAPLSDAQLNHFCKVPSTV